MIKLIWTHKKKATGSSGEEGKSNGVKPCEKGKGRPKETLGKIIKKDLMVNNIIENLAFNKDIV